MVVEKATGRKEGRGLRVVEVWLCFVLAFVVVSILLCRFSAAPYVASSRSLHLLCRVLPSFRRRSGEGDKYVKAPPRPRASRGKCYSDVATCKPLNVATTLLITQAPNLPSYTTSNCTSTPTRAIASYRTLRHINSCDVI